MPIFPERKSNLNRTDDFHPPSKGLKKSFVALAILILGAGIAAQVFLGEEIGAIGDYTE